MNVTITDLDFVEPEPGIENKCHLESGHICDRYWL